MDKLYPEPYVSRYIHGDALGEMLLDYYKLIYRRVYVDGKETLEDALVNKTRTLKKIERQWLAQ
jgi:hypothetical protein